MQREKQHYNRYNVQKQNVGENSVSRFQSKFLKHSLIENFKHKTYIPNIREIYKKILDSEKNDLYNISMLCEKLNQLNISEKDKIFVIEILLELAHIDSKYDEDDTLGNSPAL